jgi:hypothetical protein
VPGHSHACVALALGYQRASDLPRAREYTMQVLAADPRNPVALKNLGAILARRETARVLSTICASPTSAIPRTRKLCTTSLSPIWGWEMSFYLLDAMRLFRGKSLQEIKKIAFVIGMLGKYGLDINNSQESHVLRALPGEGSFRRCSSSASYIRASKGSSRDGYRDGAGRVGMAETLG